MTIAYQSNYGDLEFNRLGRLEVCHSTKDHRLSAHFPRKGRELVGGNTVPRLNE